MRFRRNLRNWNKVDILLVFIIVWLLCVLISRQIKPAQPPNERAYENVYVTDLTEELEGDDASKQVSVNTKVQDEESDDDFLTRDRLNAIPDTRPPGCPVSYPRAAEHRVSIIMFFYDYQFYDVKTTYRSIRHNTPDGTVKEILLIDAGSTIQYIKNDAKRFAKSAPKVRLLHTEIRESPTRARHFAADHASGTVLVFVDSNSICNKGWLEPLIDAIDKNPNSIAVPHYDHVEDLALNIYKKIAQKHVHVFSWALTTHLHGLTEAEAGVTPYPTPVMRGSVFAITRRYYSTLGELDEEFSQPGGEILELSLRTWMCGGAIQVIPCSRVGLLDLYDSRPVTSKHNVARLVNLWFDKPQAALINFYTQNKVQLNTQQHNGILVRKGILGHLNCKNSKWYLEKFKDVIASPGDFESTADGKAEFGYLKSESGRCAQVSADSVVVLNGCPSHSYKKDMIFEYRESGQIVVQGKCVTNDNYNIRVEPCVDGRVNQKWKRTPSGEIRLASNYKACATHVTEPGDSKRQILMAQRCKTDGSSLFTRFKFFVQ